METAPPHSMAKEVQRPKGYSLAHWIFQGKIQAPHVEDQEVVFTSMSPFGVEEEEAWWTGFELIRVADNKLVEIDKVLKAQKKIPLLASRVKGANNATELSRLIEVKNWKPLDATLKVTDVASLVQRLGGEALYGSRKDYALRELIQNARDAVVARRLIDDHGVEFGKITVGVTTENGRSFFSVSDNGVGMSHEVLTKFLLDFGRSYWRDMQAVIDHPGLGKKGFRSVGKFGIGFFSVFMLGKEVSVTTRRSQDGKADTTILTFQNGVIGRTTIRKANPHEQLREPGTIVKIAMESAVQNVASFLGPLQHGGPLLGRFTKQKDWSLADLCEWIAPCLDVDLVVSEDRHERKVVSADDWKNMESSLLLRRLMLEHDDIEEICAHPKYMAMCKTIDTLSDAEGNVFGRATLCHFAENSLVLGLNRATSFPCVVTVGGFRTTSPLPIVGVLIGESTVATRNDAIPAVFDNMEFLSDWATNQAKAFEIQNDQSSLNRAGLVRKCGGFT